MTQLDLQLESMPPAATDTRLPNFLYIGTSKAGSTWIYHVLAEHPQVFIAPSKGAYYFDSHFDHGLAWYREHFRGAARETIVGEISHSYLFSTEAAERIDQLIPAAKLMVCLREPVERAFSDYLDRIKNGKFIGTFAEAIRDAPPVTERGAYAKYLAAYLDRFASEQIHVSIFDDLKANPQGFADDLFAFLDIPTYELTPAMRQKMMPAARPRSRLLSQWAKRIARACDRLGWRAIRGRAKRSRLVRNVLYRPYAASEIPSMDAATREQLKDWFRPEIQRLDQMLGTTLAKRWGYE